MLMLHAGANRITRQDITKIETPEGTDTWHPLAHSDLLDLVTHTLARFDLDVVGEDHGVAGEGGEDYFGVLEVRARGTSDDGKEWGTLVGLRNSNRKRYPAALVAGSRVFVCDNMAFSGEVKMTHKHTSKLAEKLPGLVTEAVERVGGLHKIQEVRFGRYKAIEAPGREVDSIVIDALDAGALPASKIPRVLAEYRQPSHREHLGPDGRATTWTLFNAFTEALKGTSGMLLPKRTMDIQHILDQWCDKVSPETALAGLMPAAQ
jgi:hypothetical protein